MKILILCDRDPFSLFDGLTLRLMNLVRALIGRHTFDLVCYGNRPSVFTENLFGRVEFFKKPEITRRIVIAKFFYAFSKSQLYPKNKEVANHLINIMEQRRYDMVLDSGGNMLMNLPANSLRCPLLIDLVDDMILYAWREIKTEWRPWKLLVLLKRLVVTYLFNKQYLKLAAACVLVSEIDAKFCAFTYPRSQIAVINNGVDTNYFQPLGLPKDTMNIIFEGSMDFVPNIDGVLYFCDKILPIIHKTIPDLKFSIVGRNPPAEISRLNSKLIEVTGYVKDVRPYLDRAALLVCPLRKGGGIKNKVLQAWSMGKAVVATTPSIGGLLVMEGENILVRDDPKDFAAAVVGLIRDPREAEKLGVNGRKTILENYTWERKALELEALMEKIKNIKNK